MLAQVLNMPLERPAMPTEVHHSTAQPRASQQSSRTQAVRPQMRPAARMRYARSRRGTRPIPQPSPLMTCPCQRSLRRSGPAVVALSPEYAGTCLLLARTCSWAWLSNVAGTAYAPCCHKC